MKPIKKIDHRSYADQNNGLQATTHEGTSVTQLSRQGIGTEISRYNDKVKQHNAQYLNQKEQQRKDDTRRKILLGSYLIKKMQNEANKEQRTTSHDS